MVRTDSYPRGYPFRKNNSITNSEHLLAYKIYIGIKSIITSICDIAKDMNVTSDYRDVSGRYSSCINNTSGYWDSTLISPMP